MTKPNAVLLLLAVVLPGVVLAQGGVIEISGANFRPLPLAVAPPTVADSAKASAAEFDATLVFDLQAGGLFQLLDRKGFLADAKEGLTASSINFGRWTDVGAEFLVKTQLSQTGDELKGELRLFSVGGGKEELKLSESVPSAKARTLAHRFADAIWKHFTKETGPFQTRLTFVRPGAGGKQVWVSDWDGRNARAVTSDGINVIPALAPNGVAYTSYRRGKPDLYFHPNGGAPVSLENQGQMTTGVAFSPDGSRIAYSVAAGEGAQIWVARADGTSPRQITDTPYFLNTSPTWSPDGAKLAYVSNRAGNPQIYVQSVDGKEPPRRITFQGTYNQTPDWSPRGDLIAFTARDERNAFDLFSVNVENGRITRLTQDQANNEEPSFSPNGRLIVFTSTRSGSPQLWVMTSDGQQQNPLPLDKGSYLTPDWGP